MTKKTKKESAVFMLSVLALFFSFLVLLLEIAMYIPQVQAVVGTLSVVANSAAIGTQSPVALFEVNGKKTGKALSIFNETGDQAPLVASVAGVNKMILTNAGRLGIGTATPGQALDIVGNLNLTGAIKQNGISLVPVGTIIYYGAASIPSGWLACDGSAVSRSTYSALFTAISTSFGTGDGSTTFNVPNLKGKPAIGTDPGNGINVGGTDTNFDNVTTSGTDNSGIKAPVAMTCIIKY